MASFFGKLASLARPASPAISDGSRTRTSSDEIVTPPGRPVTPEVEETIGALLTIVEIPRQYIDGIVVELRRILSEPRHRPYDQILSRASHPCVQEYLGQVFSLLNSQQAAVQKTSRELKGADLNDFLDNTERQKDAYYTSIAELLGRGFDVALKPNLIIDAAGNPIGIREKDRTRFPTCHKVLSGTGGKRKKRQTKKKLQKKRKTLRRRAH